MLQRQSSTCDMTVFMKTLFCGDNCVPAACCMRFILFESVCHKAETVKIASFLMTHVRSAYLFLMSQREYCSVNCICMDREIILFHSSLVFGILSQNSGGIVQNMDTKKKLYNNRVVFVLHLKTVKSEIVVRPICSSLISLKRGARALFLLGADFYTNNIIIFVVSQS